MWIENIVTKPQAVKPWAWQGINSLKNCLRVAEDFNSWELKNDGVVAAQPWSTSPQDVTCAEQTAVRERRYQANAKEVSFFKKFHNIFL